MRLKEKIISALLSAIFLSLILAINSYIPVEEREIGTGYWSFSELIFVYLIYALPMFLFGGTIFSLLAETFLSRMKRNKFLIGLFVYLLGGVIIMFTFIIANHLIIKTAPFYTIKPISLVINPLMGFGVASSTLFYLILNINYKLFSEE